MFLLQRNACIVYIMLYKETQKKVSDEQNNSPEKV